MMAEASDRLGTYADGRTYQLPQTWKPLDPTVLETALRRTLDALSASGSSAPPVARLRSYYDPTTNFAGALLSTIEPTRSTRSQPEICSQSRP